MKHVYLFVGTVVIIFGVGALLCAPEISLLLFRSKAQETRGTPEHASAVEAYLKKCGELGIVNKLRKEDFLEIGITLSDDQKNSSVALPYLAPKSSPNDSISQECFFVELTKSKQVLFLEFSSKTGKLVSWNLYPLINALPF